MNDYDNNDQLTAHREVALAMLTCALMIACSEMVIGLEGEALTEATRNRAGYASILYRAAHSAAYPDKRDCFAHYWTN